MSTPVLTLPEVAALLRVTERTIYALLARRELPAFKVGGQWRFQRRDLDAWVRRNTVKKPKGKR